MAKNLFKKPHDILDHTVSADVASGMPVIITSGASGVVGVAMDDIANGAIGPVAVKNHSFTLPADAGTGKSFAVGDLLYWNASTGKLTKTASGASRMGRCGVAKTAAGTTAVVIPGWF